MADPYSKAIIQNGVQQRLLSQATRQIDCKRRKALNQIWFDRREIYRDLVCIRTKTPSLSLKSCNSSPTSASSTEPDSVDSTDKSLSASLCSTSSEMTNITLPSSESTLQSSKREKRTKPKQRRKSVNLAPKIVRRITEVNSICLNLEKLSLAIEQRQQMLVQLKIEEQLKMTEIREAPEKKEGAEENAEGNQESKQQSGHQSRDSERNTVGGRQKRSLSASN